jgi:ligand-binding sensor domain-containing protein
MSKRFIFPILFKCAIAGALISFPLNVRSQNPFFEEVAFTWQNSPVKTSVILNDSDGWLYFGTDKGLFRYDGFSFTKIICSDTITDEYVTALFQESNGKIWAGFRNGSIACYYKKKFSLFKPEEGLPKVAVTGFAESADHAIWISTNGEGIYIVQKNRLQNINMDDGLNDDYVHAILCIKNSEVVIAASDQGLNECSFHGGKKNIRNIIPAKSLPDNIITSLLETEKGLIAGTQDKGICKPDVSSGKILIPRVSNSWEKGMVNKIAIVADELWIATDDNGLVVADAVSGRLKFTCRNTRDFPHSKIKDIVCDREGNVWLACADGLVKSYGKKMRYIDSIDKEKISFVHTILCDSKGSCWFSPDQGLVKMWYDSSGNSHTKKFTLTPAQQLVDIVTLYEDPYGMLWAGTMGAGIFQVNIETGAVKKVTGKSSLASGSILNISGKGNDVWIGGFDGTVHCTIKNVKGQEELKFSENIATDSLERSYIYSTFTDSQDRTWFGTDGAGAYLFDGRKLKNFSPGNLTTCTVYSILEDYSGNIWLNTQDNGVYKFNGKRFQDYSGANGLSDASVSSMIFDKSGNLYLVHKNGLDILNRKESRFTYLKNHEALVNMNPDLNSITRNLAGDILIGTEKFILQLSAEEINRHAFPQTYLESISIFQTEIGDTLHTFSNDQNNLLFSFTGLWYTDPSLVQYQYKLEGFNDEWMNTTDREINFPKLFPGSYTFQIRSSLNSDFTNASVASFRFVINPPLWKRTWFQVMVSLLIAFLLYSFILWRDKRIRKMERLKKEAIEFQFETLKSQVNPHFLFNSFNTLISIIEEDKKTAVSYVEKLSEFFRSIVAYRDRNLIPLSEEIHLLNNYFYLQKKRFGQHLILQTDLSEKDTAEYEIPPLTLQLLSENAIKHNAISKEARLQIKIFAEDGKLVVQNNINPKMLSEKFSGLGLQNITNRFRLLTTEKVEILNDGKLFTVKIPLLKKR